MDIIIRECRIEDAEAIRQLNLTCMGYDYPLSDTERQLKKSLSDPAHRIFVATADGTVVGYVHASDYDLLYAPPMKNILGIAVSNAFTRRGIGTALLQQVEQWAASSGAGGVRLVSGASRTGAHEFYRSLGYDGGKQQLNFKKLLS